MYIQLSNKDMLVFLVNLKAVLYNLLQTKKIVYKF